MNRVILAILYLMVFVGTILAQETFIKEIVREEGRLARQIVAYEDRYFILNTGVCDNLTECCLIMEVDTNGKVLWEKKLKWLDVASKSMVVQNDTIYLSGNHPSRNRWLWHHMSVDNGDSLATYEIYKENGLYQRMSNFGTVLQGNQFCIYGSGERGDFIETSLFYFVDKQGRLDTLVELYTADLDSDPWEVIADPDDNLVAFIRYQTSETDRQTAVVRLNPEKEIIWSYFSEEDSQNSTVPNGTLLNDGRIVFNYGDEWFNWNVQSLRAINPDTTLSWKLFLENDGWLLRRFVKIKTLSDGNILAFGQWGDVFYTPVLKYVPWIIKLSPEGEILWERVYYAVTPGNDQANYGLLYDGVELPDGSLLVVGGTHNYTSEPRKILLMRLDSDGCVLSSCSKIIDMDPLVNTTEVTMLQDIEVHPNPLPAGEGLTIVLPADFDLESKVTATLVDTQGRQILHETISSPKQLISTDVPSGIYFLMVKQQGKIIHADKIIRL